MMAGWYCACRPWWHVNQSLQTNQMFQHVASGEQSGLLHYSSSMDKVDRVYAFKRVGSPFYLGRALPAWIWRMANHLAGYGGGQFAGVAGAGLAAVPPAAVRGAAAGYFGQSAGQRRSLPVIAQCGGRWHLRDGSGRALHVCQPGGLPVAGHESETACWAAVAAAGAYPRPDRQPLPDGASAIHQALRQGRSAHADDALFTWAHSLLPVRYDAYPLVKDGRDIGAVLLFQDIGASSGNRSRLPFWPTTMR
jgi:hypothetical protein